MTDLVINGLTLDTIKTQRLAIAETASSMMSKRVKKAQEMIDTILESTDPAEIEELSSQASRLLSEIHAINDATDVHYNIPYDTEWGDGDGNFSKLESLCEDLEIDVTDLCSIKELMAQLEDMEYNSNDWNSSKC